MPAALAAWIILVCATEVGASPRVEAPSGPGDGPTEVHAWSRDLGRLDELLRVEQPARALALADSLLALPEAAADSAARYHVLLRRGAVLAATGRSGEADPTLRQVARWADQAGDTLSQCAALRWRSVCLSAFGRNDESVAVCRRLLDLARRADMPRYAGWALVGLAWDEQCRGTAERALELLEEAAAALSSGGDERGVAWAQNGLGMAQERLGHYLLARRCYERSVALARSTGYRMLEGMATNNLGDLQYALGDPGAAVLAYQRALELRRGPGHPAERVVPTINIARCCAAMGRERAAEDSLESLLGFCRESGQRDLEAQVLGNYVEILSDAGRHVRVRRLARELLRSGTPLTTTTRLRALLALSRSLAESDSLEAALSLLRSGESVLRERPYDQLSNEISRDLGRVLLRAGRPAESLEAFRASVVRCERQGLAQDLPEALAGMASSWRGLGRIDSAAVLLDRATQAWEANRQVPLDPEWREQRGAAGRSVWSEFADLELEISAGDPRRARNLFGRIQRYRTRTLLERIRGLEGEDVEAPPQEATVELLQAGVLRPGEIFLDYLVGPRRSFLFVVTPDDYKVVRLAPESALAERIRLYRELLTSPARKSGGMPDSALAEGARGVWEMIFGEAGSMIAAGRRVFVAPDGPINLLSLVEMPLLLRLDREFGEREWVRVPSAALLLRARPPQVGGTRFARSAGAARGPSGDAGAGAEGRVSRGLALLGVQPDDRSLPGLRRETAALSRLYNNVRVLRVTARDTLPTPADLFGQSDFVHIAAHAWVDDQAPWRSGIELGAGEAGWLRAGDIARARTPLRLAVLSGCETAAGRILNGEGVLGLTAAFLAGGSGAVVASLWPVDDDATARLMGCFYRELAGGSPAATALTRAQRALQARARTRHPFYWAGFVLVGDGDMSINLSRKNTGWRRLAAAAAGGAAIVIALLGRDRDRSRPRSDQPAGSRGQAGGGGESIPAPARVIPRRRRRLTR